MPAAKEALGRSVLVELVSVYLELGFSVNLISSRYHRLSLHPEKLRMLPTRSPHVRIGRVLLIFWALSLFRKDTALGTMSIPVPMMAAGS